MAIVDGDVLIDCNLFVRPGDVYRQHCAGGACLVRNLVYEFARDVGPEWTVAGPQADETRPEQHHQSHAIMSFGADQIWRVERFLGVQKGLDAPCVKAGAPGLLVLFDANLGFASTPTTICCDGKPWIVLKTSEPDLDTPLGQHLVDQHANRLLVVTGIEDLRRMEVQVSRRLSWERTAQETVRAVRDGARLARLKKCAHVIVSFGTSGAAVLSGKHAQLLFDPSRMEKEWESKGPTRMAGYASTLVAAVAHQVMKNPKKPSFADAVQRGVAGMRSLYNLGYGTATMPSDKLGFPAETLVREALSAKASLSVTDIDMDPSWTALSGHVGRKYQGNVYALAVAVAELGPEGMLSDVPHLKVGKLFTADRGEIQSFAIVKELLAEYVQRTANAKPFSIAVFGPPGSGKSFGVKQVASAIGADVETRTFNLTQFSSPSDLHGAFHQIRDVSLSGKLPLVFWDEFDTRQGVEDLGWPRHFLAPMQDGEFQEGQLTHPIGRSIFVFAGGTADSWSDFQKLYPFEDPQWKRVKLKDFVSRLKGHLDVIGPNPGGSDPFSMVRRAILLRSILQRDCPWLFVGKELQIEAEVLCAFLRTPKYEHGARSMEAIVTMSGLSGKKIYDASSLPPDSQLAMHVQIPFECPGDEPALAVKFEEDIAAIERLAPMAHNVFAQTRARFGWTYSAVRDDKARAHNLLVPYSDLPRGAKDANRESVRSIPGKLAEIGYIVRRARPGEVPPMLTDEEVEKLAPLEHVIWMKNKAKEGFTHGEPTPEDPRKSPYLIEWDQLSDEFKETDRDIVRAIPALLAQAGYTFERKRAGATI
jgi:hypothetical protein